MLVIVSLLPTVGAVRSLVEQKQRGKYKMVDLDPSDGFSWIWVSNDLDSGDDSICRAPWLNLEMQKS